jgi:hypothetical protein
VSFVADLSTILNECVQHELAGGDASLYDRGEEELPADVFSIEERDTEDVL